MDEQPNDGAGGRPKFLSGTTGMIGGVTALVVALGGLATATKDLWKKEPAAQEKTADAPGSASSVQTAVSKSAQRPESYTIEGGEGGTLVKIDGNWLWTTDKNERYTYEQVSDDGTTTVAVLKQEPPDKNFYLRWPNAGGTGLQRDEGEKRWGDEIKVTVKKG